MPVTNLLAAAALIGTASAVEVQPAVDLITRNFGAKAASVFELVIEDGDCGGTKAPCFSLSQTSGKVSVTASSMSELTYGIGYYTRYICGLTIGRDKCDHAAPCFFP